MNLSHTLSLPCGARLKNRIVKTATSEGLADRHDHATPGHRRLYEIWARGGAGLLITGNVMVDRRYLERPGNVVVEDATGLQALRAWAAGGTTAQTHLWMQMSHPGRQCPKLVSKEPLAPSAVQLDLLGNYARPRAMSEAEIDDVIARFGQCANLARQAGFTGVQINAAHGYLISQFLSPEVNRREDRWGGSLAHRARLLLAIVARVRERVGADFPISVKLNAADFQRGGFSLEDSCQCALWLAAAGVDLLEISGGSFEHLRLLGDRGDPATAEDPAVAASAVKAGYFTDYALAIGQALRDAGRAMPLMVTGGFRSREAMERVLALGGIQLVGLARPFCATPDLGHRLLRGEDIPADARAASCTGNALSRWLTRFKTWRVLRVQGDVAWHARRLAQLAQGYNPENRSPAWSLIGHMWADMAHAMRRKPPLPGIAN
ncbi:NADH:flavin oxidoreductase/NADH oxidase family protein [Roseateles sp.]|jgi:2,4-dienoyl-CoA reductase-like NADH-dependent reductase (Old Yellow Enzyme family)|uniref:NADH:flavin oxidoreductase/NADH oxidase family protein n=1 Tax=Roseateles sp. TaxID=1971397 RepID=UPI003BA3E63F